MKTSSSDGRSQSEKEDFSTVTGEVSQARNAAKLAPDQAALDNAVTALGLCLKTVPSLASLRAPRVETPARQTPAEATFLPLSNAEWEALRAELERMLTNLKGVDWRTRRLHWDCLLFKLTTGCNWTRLPHRLGKPEAARKHAEVGSVSGVIEKVAAAMAANPQLQDARRAAFLRIGAWATSKRERIEEYRQGTARLAAHGKPTGPR